MSSGAEVGAGWYHKIICAVWSQIPVCQLPEIHETEKAEFTTGTRGGAAEPEEDKIQPSLLYLGICLYGCSVCGSHMSSHLSKIFNSETKEEVGSLPQIGLLEKRARECSLYLGHTDQPLLLQCWTVGVRVKEYEESPETMH